MTARPHIQPDDIVRALGEAGVAEGDTVFMHADAMAAAQLPPLPVAQRLDLLLEAVERALGPGGTLVMPTFTYSFTRGEPFDPRRSPSQVGLLTEHFRQRPGVLRSADPLFSVAASGRLAGQFAARAPRECFGPDSVFALLHQVDGKIICLGCTLQKATFLHYVERAHGVGYRYDKVFPGLVVGEDGVPAPRESCYYVRDLERASEAVIWPLERRLEQTGRLRRARLGRVGLLGVAARDFFQEAWDMLEADEICLIQEGQDRAGAQPGQGEGAGA